jgi:hypothetical protein
MALTALANSLTSFLNPGIRNEVPITRQKSGELERSEMERVPIDKEAGDTSEYNTMEGRRYERHCIIRFCSRSRSAPIYNYKRVRTRQPIEDRRWMTYTVLHSGGILKRRPSRRLPCALHPIPLQNHRQCNEPVECFHEVVLLLQPALFFSLSCHKGSLTMV